MATEQEIKIQKPTYEWMKHEGYVAEISAHNDEGKVNTTILSQKTCYMNWQKKFRSLLKVVIKCQKKCIVGQEISAMKLKFSNQQLEIYKNRLMN